MWYHSENDEKSGSDDEGERRKKKKFRCSVAPTKIADKEIIEINEFTSPPPLFEDLQYAPDVKPTRYSTVPNMQC